MTSSSFALAGSGIGDGLLRSIAISFVQRLALALGLVLGVGLLGALAFTVRSDVSVVWFDERGHFAVGMKRTDTQERLERVERELAETKRQLDIAGLQGPSGQQGRDARRYEEWAQAAEQRARDAQGALRRSEKALEEQSQLLAAGKRERGELAARLQTQQREKGEAVALAATKDREIEHLRQKIATEGKKHEYRASIAGDQDYLPLRERPERSGRTLKVIPNGAGGVLSSCRLAVSEDAVFVEATYLGVTGWISGFYLGQGR